MKNKKIASILAALMVAASLSACGGAATAESSSALAPTESSSEASSTAPAESSSEASSTAPSESSSKPIRIGRLVMNSVEMAAVYATCDYDTIAETVEIVFFDTLNTMLLELDAGRVDAINLPSAMCKYIVASNSELKIDNRPEFNGMSDYFHMATRTEDSKLNKDLSDAIDGLKSDGTLDKLISEYIDNSSGESTPIKLVKKEGAETYTVAITGDLPPMDYVAADGTPAGFNVALLNAISEKVGCNFEIIQVEAPARLSALQSAKVDTIFWMDYTAKDEDSLDAPVAELAENGIALTSSYYRDKQASVAGSTEMFEQLFEVIIPKMTPPTA